MEAFCIMPGVQTCLLVVPTLQDVNQQHLTSTLKTLGMKKPPVVCQHYRNFNLCEQDHSFAHGV